MFKEFHVTRKFGGKNASKADSILQGLPFRVVLSILSYCLLTFQNDKNLQTTKHQSLL